MLNNTNAMTAGTEQLMKRMREEQVAEAIGASPLQRHWSGPRKAGFGGKFAPELEDAQNISQLESLAALLGQINLPERMAQQQAQSAMSMPSDQIPNSGMVGNAVFNRKPGNALTALSNQINPQGGVPGLEGMMNRNAQRNMGNTFASRVGRPF